MGLRGNFSRNNLGVERFVGGGAQALTQGNLYRPSNWVNFRTQSGAAEFLKTAAYPSGYNPPASYNAPMIAGEMAAGLAGESAVTANLFPSRNMTADLTGAGTITAAAALVISMTAALAGAGDVSATITGRLNASAALTGSGAVTAAMLAKASMAAAVSGAGTVTATIGAKAALAADIVSTGEILTTANAAAAIWSALTSQYDTAGTFGAAMTAAGSAGDPWATELPGAYTDQQAGAIIYLVQQLLRNKVETDPDAGTMTVYDDDGVNILFTAPIYSDANGAVPYDGTAGINLKDRLE